MTTTTARPYLADCSCGCSFFYGPHDDASDRAGEMASDLYDLFQEAVQDAGRDTPESEAIYAAWQKADEKARRLLRELRGHWAVLECPRCSAAVTVDRAPVGANR